MSRRSKILAAVFLAGAVLVSIAAAFAKYHQAHISREERRNAILAMYACDRINHGELPKNDQLAEAEQFLAKAHSVASTKRDRQILDQLDECHLFSRQAVLFRQATRNMIAGGYAKSQIGWRDRQGDAIYQEAWQKCSALKQVLE